MNTISHLRLPLGLVKALGKGAFWDGGMVVGVTGFLENQTMALFSSL